MKKLGTVMVTLDVAEKFAVIVLGIIGLGLALSGFFREWPYPNKNLLDFVVRLGLGLLLIIFALAYFWRKR